MMGSEKQFSLDGNKTLRLSLVSGTSDAALESLDFAPAFTYTFLGDDELILSDDPELRVSVKYAADSLFTFCDYPPLYAKVLADSADHDEFVKQVARPSQKASSSGWTPYGTLYASYSLPSPSISINPLATSTPSKEFPSEVSSKSPNKQVSGESPNKLVSSKSPNKDVSGKSPAKQDSRNGDQATADTIAKEPTAQEASSCDGDNVTSHSGHQDDQFVVYLADSQTPGFLPYHRKLQNLVLFFIEGASYCNLEEYPLWQVYTIYRLRKQPSGMDEHCVVGFVTAYQFYSYPDKIRYRISQFCILPPFQRRGHGRKFYELLYDDLARQSRIAEITVEDPNDQFQLMRDISDVKRLLASTAFKKLEAPISFDDMEALWREFKLNKRQMRRVAEIGLLSKLNHGDEAAVTKYRLYVKKRIYLQNREALEDLTSRAERIAKLDETYRALVADYQETVERI